ncbi:hypothetical protein [Rhizobium leguminosarum]|nr:hypothetical protein [Rhizobium leguminosarum]
MPFELIVLGFPAILDRVGIRNESSVWSIFWASNFLASARPGLPFSSKRMDALGIQMAYAGTGESGQGEFAVWRYFVELLGVGRHFPGHPP